MIIEGEQCDAACSDPGRNLGLGFEVEGFIAQMQARIAGKPRPQPFQCIHQGAKCVASAKPRFPGICHGMESGGDAVGDELSVGVGQRDVDAKADAGSRHDLTLEGIAVEIHDARKEKQIPRARAVAAR